jgi:FMN phosphatase YigB (HAD superfamily)
MTITLLLDLDDTLLKNDIRQFMPAYLKLLSQHMSRFAAPEKTIRELLAATGVMIRNDRPDRTLEETFNSLFYPALGVEKSVVSPVIDDFYARVFPSLRSVTTPRPEAARLIDYAIKKGHRLVIATNPLFPRTAIIQRLAWAGFPPDENPFLLVPSYDSFHFAKPNPAFFTELLGQIGWPNDLVLMVGNDPDLDLKPAAQVGLATFLVTDHPAKVNPNGFSADAAGTLDELITWLDKETLISRQFEIQSKEALIATLRATPAALQSISRPLTGEQISRRPVPGEWNITEIICHLRDVDQDVNLPRMDKILAENNVFLPGVVSDSWVIEREYHSQNCEQALQDFTAARIRLLDTLGNLSESDWLKMTRHAIFGPTTVHELIGFMAAHDRTHLQQVFYNL